MAAPIAEGFDVNQTERRATRPAHRHRGAPHRARHDPDRCGRRCEPGRGRHAAVPRLQPRLHRDRREAARCGRQGGPGRRHWPHADVDRMRLRPHRRREAPLLPRRQPHLRHSVAEERTAESLAAGHPELAAWFAATHDWTLLHHLESSRTSARARAARRRQHRRRPGPATDAALDRAGPGGGVASRHPPRVPPRLRRNPRSRHPQRAPRPRGGEAVEPPDAPPVPGGGAGARPS